MSKFNPNAGKAISDKVAKEEIDKFEKSRKKDQTKATFFNRKVFEELLAKPNAAGIWVIYGENSDNKLTSVLAAATEDGKIIKDNKELKSLSAEGEGDSTFYNYGGDCPPICPPDTEEWV